MHYLGAFREWANKLIKSLTIVFERWGGELEAASEKGRRGENIMLPCKRSMKSVVLGNTD